MERPSPPGRAFLRCNQIGEAAKSLADAYFGGAGVNISRFWPGSGFGLGFGAFLTSFLPLSFDMGYVLVII